MKTAVPDPNIERNYTNYLILAVGFVFMCMALTLLLVMVVAPQPLGVPATPVSLMQTVADPVQTAVTGKTISWERHKYSWEITPRAQITMAGRVLSRRTYSRDWQSEISPLDLAMGWGELSDTKVDEWLHWRQSGRWYYYSWSDDIPYDPTYLRNHSSNVHIVPASENLEIALLKIREDDKIILEGKLIDIEATNENGRWWNKTSLTRTDSGNGACEILLVERLIWNGQAYH